MKYFVVNCLQNVKTLGLFVSESGNRVEICSFFRRIPAEKHARCGADKERDADGALTDGVRPFQHAAGNEGEQYADNDANHATDKT